jgi:adenylate cyclase
MPEDANIGIKFLERALELDPKYAAAHAYLAWALEIRFVRGGFAPSDATEGVRHARAALTYGGDDATALAIASLTLLHLGHDFAAASGAVTRALSLNASCATAFYFGAHVNAFSGDPVIAEDYANRALRLSPFDTHVYFAYQAKGLGCVRAERYDEAAVNFAKAVHGNPRGFNWTSTRPRPPRPCVGPP